jgi:hypothetical protein
MSKPTNSSTFEDNRKFEFELHKQVSNVSNFLSRYGIDQVTILADGTVDWTLRAPFNTAVPTISGTAQVGQELTADVGTWEGAYPIAFTYQWQADGADISGATSSTYTLQAAEEGTVITVVVTATNAFGSASATSAATEQVAPAA